MPQFFASTAKGLSDVMAEELNELGIKSLRKTSIGVFFDCSWEEIYSLNLNSRVASRFLKPILDFPAYEPEELYNNTFKKHDFTKYIQPHQTLMVDASVNECKLRDQRFVALKVKDAIVDQFRNKSGERPDVDTIRPDMRVYVKGYKNTFSLAIDTSGDSLFMRGYRKEAGIAPLKENLAAALIKMTGWKKDIPIIDLTCGSGTILIEAAMMALNIAPGSLRTSFGFQKLANFDKAAWKKVCNETMDKELDTLPFKFYGFDNDKTMIQKAKINADQAGVGHLIEFQRESVSLVKPPCEKGIIIMNPPYGARIGEEDLLKDVYRDLGFNLKTHFSGWECWILNGNKDLISDLKLKSSRKFFVFNGNLECRFLKYDIRGF